MKFKRAREMKKTRIEVIPMVDTMFFLLVFFLLSSLSLVKLKALHVDLPTASTAKRQDAPRLTVTIDKDRNVFVNQEKVDIDAVAEGIVRISGTNDLHDASVVINADMNSPHGLVVKCMDEARRVGIERFAIATSEDVTRKP